MNEKEDEVLIYEGSERRLNTQKAIASLDKKTVQIEGKIDLVNEKITNLDKRINGSLESIASHILESKGWRTAIVGIIGVLLVNLASAIFYYGYTVSKVNNLEDLVKKIVVVHSK